MATSFNDYYRQRKKVVGRASPMPFSVPSKLSQNPDAPTSKYAEIRSFEFDHETSTYDEPQPLLYEEQRAENDETKTVTEFVRIICSLYNGIVLLSQFTKDLGPSKVRSYFGDSKPEVFFSRYHHIFQVERYGQGDWRVKVSSQLNLCDEYRTKDGCRNTDCWGIHICKLFLLGTCRYGSPDTSSASMGAKENGLCRLSHAFQCDKHNSRVLRENGLDNFEGDVLKIIIRQSCPESFKPEICKYYNTPGGCQKRAHCLSLHLCRDYITARCRYGPRCKFSHRVFDQQPKGVLQKYGVDTSKPPSEVIRMLKSGTFEFDETPAAARERAESGSPMRRVPSNPSLNPARSRSANPKPMGVVKPSEDDVEPGCRVQPDQTIICIHHINGRCNYGNRCIKHHFNKPYTWQERDTRGGWVNLSDDRNAVYESRYCDVRVDKVKESSSGGESKLVDFGKMVAIDVKMGKVKQLRRLSTISSVKARQYEKLSTEWLWYWQDESGQWHPYGDKGGLGQQAGTTSVDIEQAYQDYIMEKGSPNSFQFTAGEQKYTLYFGHMYQQNNQYKTMKDVRRRPKYLSDHAIVTLVNDMSLGLKAKVAGKATGIPSMGSGNIPRNWDKSAKDLGGYRLVTLAENGGTADEYEFVAKRFQETMPHDLIVSIERVQNIELWKFLIRRTEAMRKWRSDNKVEVRHLFHGTSEKFLDVICRQNFDWRLSGSSTGTAFGKGTYFATSAKYSDSYTQSSNLYRKIFLARVAVGDYIQGRPDYVRPPAKSADDPFGQLFDSCVNNESNPSIFVIFESTQVYPEYVITYMRHQELDNLMR